MTIAARAGHRFDPRRGTVTLRVHPIGASIFEDYELTTTEAKRLAWGLLADLEPDEIDQAATPEGQAIVELRDVLLGLAERPGCRCGGRPRIPKGKAGQILAALAKGDLTARRAGEIIDRDTSIASSFIIQLVRDGYAVAVSGGMFGQPTVYAITPAGRAVQLLMAPA